MAVGQRIYESTRPPKEKPIKMCAKTKYRWLDIWNGKGNFSVEFVASQSPRDIPINQFPKLLGVDSQHSQCQATSEQSLQKKNSRHHWMAYVFVINYCQWLHPFCVWILPCIFRCFVDASTQHPFILFLRKQFTSAQAIVFHTRVFRKHRMHHRSHFGGKYFHIYFITSKFICTWLRSLAARARVCCMWLCACAGQHDVVHTSHKST